jgi:hypothetical protein
MSIIPSTAGIPQGFTPKTFWQRPEGGAGKGLLIFGAIAAGVALFWFWGLIVPFVLTTLADTLMASIYAGVLVVAAMIAFGIPPFAMIRVVIKNAFQSFSRGIARCYTEIDPIGILRNNLDDMKKEKAELDGTVEKFSGSEEALQRKISDKNDEARKAYAMSQQAAQRAAAIGSDPAQAMQKQQLELASETNAEKAGLLLQGVKQLQALEVDTKHLLTTFQNWSQLADAKIQRTQFKVDFLAEQRTTILAAKSTLSVGQRLLRGKPEQLQMVDNAIEYLEQDTANTLGQIREFSRYTDKLMTNESLESGADAELARQQFAEFSQKLLTAGSAPSAADFIQIPGVSSPVPVARAASAGAASNNKADDFDPFK